MEISPRHRLQLRHHRTLNSGTTTRILSDDPETRDINSTGRLPEVPDTPVPRSWAKTLWKIGKNTVLATLAGTSLIGGIAYQHNYDALSAPVSSTNPVDQVPVSHAPRQAWVPSSGRSTQQPVMPQSTARQLFEKVQQSPQMQKLLATQVARVQTQVQDRLAHLPAFHQTQLLDVQAPLPTGEGSLLGIGSLQLPSMGIHDLQTESVPIRADTTASIGTLQARITIEPVQVATPSGGPPGGVYLGSFHTQVKAASPSVSVTGQVHVGLDLQGTGTQEQLGRQRALLAQTPAGTAEFDSISRNIQHLTARLAQGEHLAARASQNGFDKDMDKVMADQGSSFKLDLPLSQTAPLVDGFDHLWLVPGEAGGPPHIVVTDQLTTPGLDTLSLPTPQLTPLAHRSGDGVVLDQLRNAVQKTIQKQIAHTFGDVAKTIPATAQDTVQQQWCAASSALQTTANGMIDHLFQEAGHLQVNVQKTLVPLPAEAGSPPPSLATATGTPLPARQLQEIYSGVQRMPAFQSAIRAGAATAQAQVQKALDGLGPITQRDLVDVKVSLPEDLARLVGSPSITAPIVVSNTGQVSPIKVKVDIAPVTMREAPRQDGMVYLGSYRTTVYAQTPVAHVKAQSTVSLDLDGHATQEALRTAQEQARGVDPASARGQALQTNIHHLQERLASSKSLSTLTAGASGPLAQMMADQGVTAAFDVPLPPDVPLMIGTAHVFAAPGGPEGLPRVVVTEQLATPGLDALKITQPTLGQLPHQPGSLEKLHQALADRIQQAAGGVLAQAGQDLPSLVRGRAQDAWHHALAEVQTRANTAIQGLVQEHITPSAGAVHIAPAVLPARAVPVAPVVHPGPLPAGSMAVVIPPGTLARIVAQAQNSPGLQREVAEATARAQAQFSAPQAQDGQELMDVKLPGGLDLPLVISHHVQASAIPAQVQITPVILPAAQRPAGPKGAVYLGSYRSQVWATQPTMAGTGQVRVALDTDGRATAAQLKELQSRLGSVSPTGMAGIPLRANIERLQARLDAIHQMQGLKLPADAQQAVDALTHQQIDFSTSVTLPTHGPLLTGVDHLWLTADGIRVTGDLQTPGASGIGLANTTFKVVPHAVPAGFEPFQKLIAERLQTHAQQALTQVTSELPGRMTELARNTWDKTTTALQSSIDKEVGEFYAQHGQVHVPLGDGKVASPLTVGLVRLTVTPAGDAAAILTTVGGHESFVDALRTAHPGSGIETEVSGDSINTILRDRSQGGNIDWNSLLQSMARGNNVKSLQFNHDSRGQLLTPHLVQRGGQLRAEFDMTAEMGGLRPVGAITGAIAGGGDQHSVGGGIKSFLDHTIGVVVDTLPDLATRPVVSIHVSVPLQFDTQNGRLTIRPDIRGLEVGQGQGDNGKILFPLQLPGSAIGQNMINEHGARMLGPALAKVAVPVDLRTSGVDITGVTATPTSHGTPNLRIQAALTPGFSLDKLAGLH